MLVADDPAPAELLQPASNGYAELRGSGEYLQITS